MDIKDKILNKCIKISIKDGRIIYGILHSLDKQTNMIVHDAAIQMPDKFISPIQNYIATAFKLDNLIQKYLKLSDEIINDQDKLKQIELDFWKNKYYSGQIMVPGDSIMKIEIQV